MIEAVIALAIISAVSVVFLVGMTTSSRAVIVSHEQVTGESLAKSQMEYIKRQAYRVDLAYDEITLSQEEIDAGYDMGIVAEPMNPRGDTAHNDDGLQKITIIIIRDGVVVFTLEGYKSLIGQ